MKQYFTFGQSHAHRFGNITLDKDIIVEIEENTKEDCRNKMFELFGNKWSNQYDDYQSRIKYFPRGVYSINDSKLIIQNLYKW